MEQLHVVVVGAWRHRRPRVEPQEAPLRDPAVFGTVRVPSTQDSAQLPAGLDLRPHGRNASIRWIDDERRPLLGERVTPLEPDAQAVADARLERGVLKLRFETRPLNRELLFPLSRFLYRQRFLAGQLLGPFHRRGRREVPDALQVGVALRCSERRTLALAGGARRHEQDDGAHQRHDAYGPTV